MIDVYLVVSASFNLYGLFWTDILFVFSCTLDSVFDQLFVFFFFFFFKQNTAYEMRISDWSSDVCSSDLSEKFRSLRPTPFKPRFRASRQADSGACVRKCPACGRRRRGDRPSRAARRGQPPAWNDGPRRGGGSGSGGSDRRAPAPAPRCEAAARR